MCFIPFSSVLFDIDLFQLFSIRTVRFFSLLFVIDAIY